MNSVYQPISCRIKCEFLDCVAGMGLAGSGTCFNGGAWWMQCCPEYKNENEFLNERKNAYERSFEFCKTFEGCCI